MVRTGTPQRMERADDEPIPSTWFTTRERARDDLFLQLRDMRRSQTPIPPAMERQLEQRNAELEAARAHNGAIEERHRLEVNAIKQRERERPKRKAS